MKLIKTLPFYSLSNDTDIFDCALFSSDTNICELKPDVTDHRGECSEANMFFGTSDSREPKFCTLHFFTEVINKDYDSLLISEKEAEKYL